MSPPRPRGRPRKELGAPNDRTDTREALIREGLRQWSERGWAEVGVKELLDAVGVPKGSFYHYFESKEAFGLAVLGAYDASMRRRLGRALEGGGNVQAQLSRFIQAGKEAMVRGEFRRGCLVGNLGQELGSSDGALRAALEAVLASWELELASLLRGGARTEGEAAEAARFFWASWEGAVFRAKLARSTQALDDFAAVFMRLLEG